MQTTPNRFDRWTSVATWGLALLVAGNAGIAWADDVARGLVPLDDVAPKRELAPSMGDLQRLTHKLSLAIGGGDLELTQFYAYESIELLRQIQREIPEYDGQPIAMLVDRLAMPAYADLTRALTTAPEAIDAAGAEDSSEAPSPARVAAVGRAVSGVVAICNDCHRATHHDFIRITDERRRNPFNQRFSR